MKAIIWKTIDGIDYKHGTYDIDVVGMNYVNEVASNIKNNMDVPVWVERVEE